MQLDIEAANLMAGLFIGAGMTLLVIAVMWHFTKDDNLPPPEGGDVLLTTKAAFNRALQQAQEIERKAWTQPTA